MFIHIDGVPFHYAEKGDPSALPVIFLHGFPFSLEMWAGQVAAVGENHRAVAYDLRGHGKSHPGDGQFTIEGHVDDLAGFLDQLNIKKAVVVGLSMGGYIALRALEREPERFAGVVLCDTKSEADSNEDKLKRFKTIKHLKQNGTKAFAEGFLKNAFAPETFDARPEAVELIRKAVTSTLPSSITGTLLALASRTDTTASLSAIRVPALILTGEKDAITPPANAKSMHEKIAGSELHILPHAGHLSNLENPAVFNAKLLAFLHSNFPS